MPITPDWRERIRQAVSQEQYQDKSGGFPISALAIEIENLPTGLRHQAYQGIEETLEEAAASREAGDTTRWDVRAVDNLTSFIVMADNDDELSMYIARGERERKTLSRLLATVDRSETVTVGMYRKERAVHPRLRHTYALLAPDFEETYWEREIQEDPGAARTAVFAKARTSGVEAALDYWRELLPVMQGDEPAYALRGIASLARYEGDQAQLTAIEAVARNLPENIRGNALKILRLSQE